MKHIFFSAGEPSGDLHAAAVLSRLSGVELSGIGGDRMIEAGLKPLFHLRELTVMGFAEVAAGYLRLKGLLGKAGESLRAERPDLLVLVDYPGFNLRLAAVAAGLNIPVLYYIAPKVWVWGRGRLKRMAKIINRMAVIFPFEEAFFSEAGIRARYVGNPVSEIRYPPCDRGDFLKQHGIPGNARLLGLLPGSRRQEVERNLPEMLKAAQQLLRQGLFDRVILSRAAGVEKPLLQRFLLPGMPVSLVEDNPCPLFCFSDFLFIKSGTATLEAALQEKPFVVMYRTSPLSAWVMRRLVRIPFFSMANILCGKKAAPELFQGQARAGNLVKEAKAILLQEGARETMIREFRRLKEELAKHSPADEVADIIREMLNG